MAPPRPGRPRADTSRLGHYHLMTRETHPGNFVSAEQAALDQAAANATMDRLLAIRARERGKEVPIGDKSDDDDREEPLSEVDDDETSDYDPGQEKRKRPSTFRPKGKKRAVVAPVEEEIEENEDEDEENLHVSEGEEVTEKDTKGDDGEEDDEDANVDATADILDVNHPGWKLGNSMSQPLAYYVDTDAVGGLKAKTIRFNVDFNSRQSVNKANKARRLEVDRAKKRHGILAPLKRPSTKGREYTEENHDWIGIIHEDYAIHNNGQRIPAPELTDRFNEQFPAEKRTQASILSHIDRIPALKNMRNTYPVN